MSEIHGATGSYVLNALDPSELDEFEAHLAVCATCSQEVVEFCETASELSLLAAVTAPPPALKGSVMSAIRGVRVLPPEASPGEDEQPVPAATPLPAPAEVEHQPQRAVPVDELALRRARRRARVLSLAVAAALVVALAMGGWVVSLKQQPQVAAPSLETQVYRAPDVTITQFTLKNGAQASFVASKSLNKAFLTSTSLPDPGPGKTYQLWTLRGKQAVPDNLVGGGKGVDAWFRGDITQASSVALSIEPAGGSTQPTVTTIQTVATI